MTLPESFYRSSPVGPLRLSALALTVGGMIVADGTYDDGHPTLGMVAFLVTLGFAVALLIVDALIRTRLAAIIFGHEEHDDDVLAGR